MKVNRPRCGRISNNSGVRIIERLTARLQLPCGVSGSDSNSSLTRAVVFGVEYVSEDVCAGGVELHARTLFADKCLLLKALLRRRSLKLVRVVNSIFTQV